MILSYSIVLTVVENELNAPISAIARSATNSPYSIAVAPRSSAAKLRSNPRNRSQSMTDMVGLTKDQSGAGSAEYRQPASHTRAACWGGPTPDFGLPSQSPRLPNAGTHRAASSDGNRRRHGSRKSAAPD